MSKKFKSQASAANARTTSAAVGSSSLPFGFSSPSANGFQNASSSLSYVAEQPDLSTISNSNLVVTLRNLGKRDSVTKSKALEELQEFVSAIPSSESLETGLLEAWV
jgi:E3 ubiquitin-protein ligase listerin